MVEAKNVYVGSVPDTYHRYLVPLLFEAYARDLADRVSVVAGAVLELACGTGVLTERLLARLPEAVQLVATDINADMLSVAEVHLGGAANLDCRIANGVELPFADASFDVVICQFGVMFFPDITAGYREAARVLKPGGRLLFNVWDSLEHNGFSRSVHEVVVTLDSENPPDFLSLPYAYCSVDETSGQLRDAGFSRVDAITVAKRSRAASPLDVALGLAAGSPLAAQLAARGIGSEAVDAIAERLAQEYGPAEISAPMQAIVFEAAQD